MNAGSGVHAALAVQPRRLRVPPSVRIHMLTLAATVLVATSFPVGAAITNGLDSVVLTLLRFALAALLFAPIVYLRHGLAVPGVRDLVRYAAISACLVGFFWGMFSALRYTSALNTAAIFALTPVITAGFAAVLLGQRPPAAARLALLLGFVGATWVVFRGDVAAFGALDLGKGDLIFLGATVMMALYSTLVKRLHRGEPMAQMTFWTLATGTVWLLLLAAPRLTEVAWGEVALPVYGGILYLAVFTTLVTFFVYQWSMAQIGPTRVMAYTYLNPLLVLAIGFVLGDGLPPLATYPGIVLAVAATVIVQRDPPPRQ